MEHLEIFFCRRNRQSMLSTPNASSPRRVRQHIRTPTGTEKSIQTDNTKRRRLRTMLGLSRHETSIYQMPRTD